MRKRLLSRGRSVAGGVSLRPLRIGQRHDPDGRRVHGRIEREELRLDVVQRVQHGRRPEPVSGPSLDALVAIEGGAGRCPDFEGPRREGAVRQGGDADCYHGDAARRQGRQRQRRRARR